MNFVEVTGELVIWPAVTCVIVGIAIAFLGFSFSIDEDQKTVRNLFFVGGVVGLLLLGGGAWNFTDAMSSDQDARNEQKALIAQEIVDTYGVILEQDQITTAYSSNARNTEGLYPDSGINLNYPTEKPAGDFKTFGSVTVKFLNESDELVENRTTLVWVDGEMRLYGQPEGEEIGAELPRVD